MWCESTYRSELEVFFINNSAKHVNRETLHHRSIRNGIASERDSESQGHCSCPYSRPALRRRAKWTKIWRMNGSESRANESFWHLMDWSRGVELICVYSTVIHSFIHSFMPQIHIPFDARLLVDRWGVQAVPQSRVFLKIFFFRSRVFICDRLNENCQAFQHMDWASQVSQLIFEARRMLLRPDLSSFQQAQHFINHWEFFLFEWNNKIRSPWYAHLN